jgi:hypothetical protein
MAFQIKIIFVNYLKIIRGNIWTRFTEISHMLGVDDVVDWCDAC